MAAVGRASLVRECDALAMDDHVTGFCAASERRDVEAMLATLAPGAELISPISIHMTFRGAEDLRVLFEAVYGALDGLRWAEQVGDGDVRVVLGEARVRGVRLTDAMVFELAPDGRIRRIRPHLRPWLALTVMAAVLGPKVGRHPGVIRRALGGSPAVTGP